MTKRLDITIENFSLGINTYPKTTRHGALHALQMDNLRVNSDGGLGLRHVKQALNLGVQGIQGIARDGRGGLFLHTGDTLRWYDGSTVRLVLTNTGARIGDLRGALSSVTTFVDYVLLTSEGSDPGYLVDMTRSDAPRAYSMVVAPPTHSAIPSNIENVRTSNAEDGVRIWNGWLYYLAQKSGSQRYVPIALGNINSHGGYAPPMVWEYALTYERELQIGEEDGPTTLGRMESALGPWFTVTMQPDNVDFQYTNFSGWTFPSDEGIKKINLYRRPRKYLTLPEGAEGVEDVVEGDIDFDHQWQRRLFEFLKGDDFRSRDADVHKDEDKEWKYRYVGSVERVEGETAVLRDEYDGIDLSSKEHHIELLVAPPLGTLAATFRDGQIFEDTTARAYSEASASGLPEEASQITEHNTVIFASSGDEARYSEFEYGNLRPWAYPPVNSFRYPTECIFSHYGTLFFGSNEGLWRLGGIEQTYRIDKVADIGPVSGQAVALSRTGGALFIGSGGLWQLLGSSISPFGRPNLDAFFENRQVESGAAASMPDGSVLFALKFGNGERLNIFYDNLGGFQTWSGFSPVQFAHIGKTDQVFALNSDGELALLRYDMVDLSSDRGLGGESVPITWLYETQDFDWSESGYRAKRKLARFVDVSGVSEGEVTIESYADGALVGRQRVRLGGDRPSRAPVYARGKRFRFRVYGEGAVEIESLRMLGEVSERKYP